MQSTAKQFAKYGSYNMRDLGVKERYIDTEKEQGPDSHGITEGRRDAFNSMINLLLNHQQEIVKVPACSTYESAQEWCNARPKSGYRAGTAHLNDDRIPEVVVYDRKGAPFIVNGYKMKGSDYGLRSEYYTANPTKKHRAINPMREWLNDSCWSSTEDPENPYRKVNIKRTAIGDKLKSKGWKIPAKPKAQQSVYSIFCKLVAPYVKRYFASEDFLKLFRGMSDEQNFNVLAVKPTLEFNIGPANGEFMRRIITPITIYRYLYMKLVLRNYFFQLVDQQIINPDYRQFEQFMKEHKNSFFDWFCRNFLDKAKGLKDFSDARVSDAIIAYNMSKGTLNTDGSDINDGLVFLVGVDNWADPAPFMLNGQDGLHFIDLVMNQEAAASFLTALQNKDKVAKQFMAVIKERAQASAKQFFKDRLKQKFFLDQGAYNEWKGGHEAGCFTAGSGEAFQEHVARDESGKATSPTKAVRQMVENVSEKPAVDDDDDDDGELPTDE